MPFFIGAGVFLYIMINGSSSCIKRFEKGRQLSTTTETLAFMAIFMSLIPVAVVSAVFSGVILLFPGYVFHIYAFVKSKSWWKKQHEEEEAAVQASPATLE